MKTIIIILLCVVAIVLALQVSGLRKELAEVSERADVYNRRNNELQRKLIDVSRAYEEEKRVLAEIKENVAELESKVQLETLEKRVPKKTWDEIKPIIDRLRGI